MTSEIQFPNILLTAFRDSSAELLITRTKSYRTLLLSNDRVKDSEELIDAVLVEKTDYIISFGQKPNIRNKVHIETTAKDSDLLFNTDFDCDRLKCLFEQNGVISKISHNAGTSFCNQLYLNVLKYIFQNSMDTKMVFIHIPFIKNISDFDNFTTQIFDTILDLGILNTNN